MRSPTFALRATEGELLSPQSKGTWAHGWLEWPSLTARDSLPTFYLVATTPPRAHGGHSALRIAACPP